jgi:hypothetical protein
MGVYDAILLTLYTGGLGQCFDLVPTVSVKVPMCLRVSIIASTKCVKALG